jgi:S1-C subfamily serine protease
MEYRIDRSVADTIISIDGVKVTTADEFLTEVENKHPGDEVTLTILRGGRQMTVRLRLSESHE